MVSFGLAVILGGFFAEGVKDKHLLSVALFDSAISTAPQPVVPQTDASLLYSEKSRSRLLEVAVAVCLLFLANSVFKQYTNRLRACPAFAASMAIISKADAATAPLGEPIQPGSFVRGIVHKTPQPGNPFLSIPF